MNVSQHLAELGLALPPVAPPVGSYQPVVRLGCWGDLVFTAGQLPLADGQLLATGVVGEGGLTTADAAACARLCALNALAAAAGAAGGIDRLTGIVKLTVFVASVTSPAFTGQAEVANGASDLLVEIFGPAGCHARSAVGVAALPLGAPVEVDLIAQVKTSPQQIRDSYPLK